MSNPRVVQAPELLYSPASSVGRRFSSAGTPWAGFALETHDAPERGDVSNLCNVQLQAGHCLTLIESGHSKVEYRRGRELTRRRVNPGYASLASDQVTLDRISWTGRASYTVIGIPRESCRFGVEAGDDRVTALDTLHDEARDPQVEALVGCMLRNIQAGCPGGRVFAESIGIALVAHLRDRYSRPADLAPARRSLSSAECRRIEAFVEARLDRDVGVNELAALVGLSPSYFTAQFRESFSVTPYRYLVQRRLDEAKRLLTRTDLPLSEVALRVGFSDQSHLTHAFRRFEGVPPARWRRRAIQ